MSPTNCQQPIVTNQLSSTNDFLATCLLQGVGCTPRCWLALLGLHRCSTVICVRGVQKHCVLQGFVGVEDPQFGQWRNAKTMGFTRVVSVMRAARACITAIFESTQMAQNVPQDEPTEAPKIGQRWVNIAPRWPNIGPRGGEQMIITHQLLPTKVSINCYQPIVSNELAPTNCHQPRGQHRSRTNGHQPSLVANQLPPTNCHQPIVINQMSSTNCHPQSTATHQLLATNCYQPIVTNQLLPTSCHQPIVINQLSSTSCHAPIVTNKLPPANCHPPIAPNKRPPTNCHQ